MVAAKALALKPMPSFEKTEGAFLAGGTLEKIDMIGEVDELPTTGNISTLILQCSKKISSIKLLYDLRFVTLKTHPLRERLDGGRFSLCQGC